jgi:transposase
LFLELFEEDGVRALCYPSLVINNPTIEKLWLLFYSLLLNAGLASEDPKTGRKRVSDKRIFETIHWMIKTGCQWRDLPKGFPSKSTCFLRLKEWRDAGLFEALLAQAQELIPDEQSVGAIDASFVRARCGGDGIGVTRIGKGSCLQVICTLNSLPFHVLVYPAGPAEARVAEEWIEQEGLELPDLLLGDAAYDTNRLRKFTGERGCELITTNNYGKRAESLDPPSLRSVAKGLRWVVERFFAWLGGFRRVVTRYDKNLKNYSKTVALAIASIIVKQTEEAF